ncbi:ubiquinol-cytochrome c reductase cytochrome b subunit, partial [Rhodococcus maanshanensis]
RSDRQVLEHGIETGVIKRLPHGEYVEVHQPLGPVDDHGHPIPLEYQGTTVPKKMNKLGSAGKPGSGSLLVADPAEQSDALAAAAHKNEHDQLAILKDVQDKAHGHGAYADGMGHGPSGDGSER